MHFFLPDSFILCKTRRINLRVTTSQNFLILTIHSIIRSYVRDKKVSVPYEAYFSRCLINLFSILFRVYNRNSDQQFGRIFLIFHEICPVFGPTKFATWIRKMFRYWLTLHALPIGKHEILLFQPRLANSVGPLLAFRMACSSK